jgi:hypothetical protein
MLEVAMTIPHTTSGFAAPAALMPLGLLATLPDNPALMILGVGLVTAGFFGGWAYAGDGWPGVAAFIGALSLAALAVALRLTRVPPPAHLRRG